MKSFDLFYVLVMFYLLCSCSGNENKNVLDEDINTVEIDLDNSREYQLSEFVDELKYVRLKTPDDVLGDGLVKIKNKYIYYWDLQQRLICVFDKTGELITKLNRIGEGPGEYGIIQYFFVSDDEKVLEVWDLTGRKIIRYDNISFDLIGEESIDQSINFSGGVKLDNGQYLLSTNQARNVFNDEETNASFFLCDDKGAIVDPYFEKKYQDESIKDYVQFSLFNNSMVQIDSKEIFASVNFDNHIYRFTESKFIPVAKVNYVGGKSIDNDELLKMSRREQFDYFVQSDQFLKTASFPNMAINNETLMIVNYRYREKLDGPMELRHFIDLKKDEKLIHARSIVNDLSNFPKKIQLSYSNSGGVLCKPWHKNQLVSVIAPGSELQLDSTVVVESIGEVAATDNPIIVFMKLKR